MKVSQITSRVLFAAVSVAALSACGSKSDSPPSNAMTGGAAGAMTSGGAGGEAGGGMATDPCKGASVHGRCTTPTTFELCEVPTDGAHSRVITRECAAGEQCQVATNGEAACALVAACRNDDTECMDASTLRTCVNNAWLTTPCAAGCVATAAKAACEMPGVVTSMHAGKVVFERLDINAEKTALDPVPKESPARGFTVSLLRGDQLVASTTTSTTDGSFELALPMAVAAGDVVRVSAQATDGAGNIAYAILDPGFAAGTHMTSEVETPTTLMPKIWAQDFPVDAMTAGGATLKIALAQHRGGTANVFDKFGAAWRDMKTRFGGKVGDPIVIWMGEGVAWDCGACVGSGDQLFFGNRFRQQMWYPADADQSYFSDPVILHETGHWVMGSYGRSPGEGGGHEVTCESFPGLAWSDGFATWFGQYSSGSPIYFDIQKGSLFWFDYGTRTGNDSMGASAWPRPQPTNMDVSPSTAPGVLQKISEGEVCSILWSLSKGTADPDPILKALASKRMTEMTMVDGVNVFERKYFRHQWEHKSGCMDVDVNAFPDPAPIMTDLLDAMVCADFDKARVDEAVAPMMHYPYPSAAALCRQ